MLYPNVKFNNQKNSKETIKVSMTIGQLPPQLIPSGELPPRKILLEPPPTREISDLLQAGEGCLVAAK